MYRPQKSNQMQWGESISKDSSAHIDIQLNHQGEKERWCHKLEFYSPRSQTLQRDSIKNFQNGYRLVCKGNTSDLNTNLLEISLNSHKRTSVEWNTSGFHGQSVSGMFTKFHSFCPISLNFLTYVLLSYFIHLNCANIHILLPSFSFLMT